MKIDSTDYYETICNEIQRHLEDSEVSKLSHFYAADRYEKIHKYYIGLPTTVAALLLAWFVAQKELPDGLLYSIKLILSLIVAISSGIGTFLNYNELASKHRDTALKYQDIWRKCKNWKTDFPDDTNISEAKKIAQDYRQIMTEINQDSPQIPKWAWKSVAKQRLEGSTKYKND